MAQEQRSETANADIYTAWDKLELEGFEVVDPGELDAGDMLVIDSQDNEIPVRVRMAGDEGWIFLLSDTVVISRKGDPEGLGDIKRPEAEGEIYILLKERPDKSMAYYIVPAEDVHTILRNSYAAILAERGKVPEEDVPDDIVLRVEDVEDYENRWSVLDSKVTGNLT